MSAEITTTGILINQTPVKGVLNPWETHTFSHQIELVEDPEIETHLEWRITGDLPAGLSIDPVSGLISGTVGILNYDPYVKDKYPKEKMLLSGKNWKNVGRPMSATYTYNFTVHRDYTVIDTEAAEPDTFINKTVSSDCSIMVIKHNDIDTIVYLIEYLKSESSVIQIATGPKTVQHKLGVDDKLYAKDQIQEYLEALNINLTDEILEQILEE
jgi:hypothetical protein